MNVRVGRLINKVCSVSQNAQVLKVKSYRRTSCITLETVNCTIYLFYYLCVAPTSLRDTWHQHLEYKQKQCQKCKALIFNITQGMFERKWCAISHKWANPHAAGEVQKTR